MTVDQVSGVGPATAKKLIAAGIDTIEKLASSTPETLKDVGIGAKTAQKIITNAQEMAPTTTAAPAAEPTPVEAPKEKAKKVVEEPTIEEIPEEVEAPKKKAKKVVEEPTIEEIPEEVVEAPKKKAKKEKPAKKAKPSREDRSPAPQGIPTKKKRGFQISRTAEESPRERVEKAEGWVVESRELSKEEIEERKRRQEELNKARKITRPIPQWPVPVKAVKTEAKEKGERPVKQEKVAKKVTKLQKKQVEKIEYFSPNTLKQETTTSRKRGISSASGESKPRVELDRDTYLGQISTHRRSRRVIHEKQVILELVDDYEPDMLVGQQVYFVYPDTGVKVPGSIGKSFGKKSSKKVLIYFKRGIRMEGLHQKVYVK